MFEILNFMFYTNYNRTNYNAVAGTFVPAFFIF